MVEGAKRLLHPSVHDFVMVSTRLRVCLYYLSHSAVNLIFDSDSRINKDWYENESVRCNIILQLVQ